MQVKNLIYKMLTTSTGRAICDSGDAYGRNWEKNQAKTLADFEREPSASVEVSKWEREGVIEWDCYPTFSLYHHLVSALDLDPICDEFNALECGAWNGDYYGTDSYQCEWLENEGFKPDGDSWNSYNWSANFSQVVQGQRFKRNGGSLCEDGGEYILLQIHQGCDVRGGYTDAKLFKLKTDYFLYESAGFCADLPNGEYIGLDWQGSEWINLEGTIPSDDELKLFCSSLGEGVHAGEAFELN